MRLFSGCTNFERALVQRKMGRTAMTYSENVREFGLLTYTMMEMARAKKDMKPASGVWFAAPVGLNKKNVKRTGSRPVAPKSEPVTILKPLLLVTVDHVDEDVELPHDDDPTEVCQPVASIAAGEDSDLDEQDSLESEFKEEFGEALPVGDAEGEDAE